MDLVMILPPGMDNGAFVLLPDSVWYGWAILLFSSSVATDTGSKSFNCALIPTLESYDVPENGTYIDYAYFMYYGIKNMIWLL